MRNVRWVAVAAVLMFGLTANAVDNDTLTLTLVDSNGSSSASVAQGGGPVTLQIRGTLAGGAAETDGLALWGVDMVNSAGLHLSELLALGSPAANMDAFDKDDGLTNPAGYGGTPSGGNLLQIGGGQNTIDNILTVGMPTYPVGTVIEGVAFTETVLASGLLDTSTLGLGTYDLRITSGFANTLNDGETAQPYAVSSAAVAGDSSFVLTVVASDTTPPEFTTVGDPVKSWKTHPTAGDLYIALPPGSTGTAAKAETRMGSVTKLTVAFNEPMQLPGTADIYACGVNSTAVIYPSAVAFVGGSGDMEIELTYSSSDFPNGEGGTPNDADRYVMVFDVKDVAGNSLSAGADDDVEFQCSLGNTKSNNPPATREEITTHDLSEIRVHAKFGTGTPVVQGEAHLDVQYANPPATRGKLTTHDMTKVRTHFTGAGYPAVPNPPYSNATPGCP